VTLSSALAIYFVLWWVVLFTVLPFGVRSQEEHGEIVPGSDPGAPAAPRLVAKAIWTTIVSAVIFAVIYMVYTSRLVTVDELARWMGL
jgi:predicted secreted protein